MTRFRLLRVWATTLRILASAAAFTLVRRLRGAGWAADAAPLWGRRSARRAMATVVRVQGLFIKVGQLASVLAGALPSAVRQELAGLQDRIPPRPWAEVEARLAAELGAPPAAVFATIEPRPIAAASLAQVHAATLTDGRPVAVKVQHADIERLAARDLATMRRILVLVGLITRARGLGAMFDEIRSTIETELDFAREAEQAERIAAQLADDPTVGVPRVVHELSSRRVLVTERVDGDKVTDLEALAARGVDPRALARRILETYCRMIFVHGVYHADPHPGNLFVDRQNRLVFVDFGAVGEISPAMRSGLPQLVESVVRRDARATRAALSRLGLVPWRGDDEVAGRLIDYVYGRLLDRIDWHSFDLAEVRFDAGVKLELMADLRRLDLALHDITAVLRVPREWLLLLRTAVLLLGVCTELDPALRPLPVLRPHLEPLLLGEGRRWSGLVGAALKDLGVAALTLPGDLRRLLARADAGDLHLEIGGLREGTLLLLVLGRQIVLGLLALGSGGLAYAAQTAGNPALARLLAAVAAILVLAIVVSVWRARSWLRRLRRGLGGK